MDDSIVVQEIFHRFWKYATLTAFLLSLLFFVLFWNTSAVFWNSIFRFSSFIFFSLAVLGYLNIMNGPLTIHIDNYDYQLMIRYQKKGSMIQEEPFEKATIKEVIPVQQELNIINRYLAPSAAALKVHFTDTDRPLYLLEFGGRPLFLAREDIQQIGDFLEKEGISTRNIDLAL